MGRKYLWWWRGCRERRREKYNEYMRNYFKNHKEIISKWQKEHRDKVNEYSRRYNRKRMEKLRSLEEENRKMREKLEKLKVKYGDLDY